MGQTDRRGTAFGSGWAEGPLMGCNGQKEASWEECPQICMWAESSHSPPVPRACTPSSAQLDGALLPLHQNVFQKHTVASRHDGRTGRKQEVTQNICLT